jgi:hypothetical protein
MDDDDDFPFICGMSFADTHHNILSIGTESIGSESIGSECTNGVHLSLTGPTNTSFLAAMGGVDANFGRCGRRYTA